MAVTTIYDEAGRERYIEVDHVVEVLPNDDPIATHTRIQLVSGATIRLEGREVEARRDMFGSSSPGLTPSYSRRARGGGPDQIPLAVSKRRGTGAIEIYNEITSARNSASASFTASGVGNGHVLDPRFLRVRPGYWRIVVPSGVQWDAHLVAGTFRRMYQVWATPGPRWYDITESETAGAPTNYRVANDRFPNEWSPGTFRIRIKPGVTRFD